MNRCGYIGKIVWNVSFGDEIKRAWSAASESTTTSPEFPRFFNQSISSNHQIEIFRINTKSKLWHRPLKNSSLFLAQQAHKYLTSILHSLIPPSSLTSSGKSGSKIPPEALFTPLPHPHRHPQCKQTRLYQAQKLGRRSSRSRLLA